MSMSRLSFDQNRPRVPSPGCTPAQTDNPSPTALTRLELMIWFYLLALLAFGCFFVPSVVLVFELGFVVGYWVSHWILFRGPRLR